MEFISTYFELIVVFELALLVIGLFIISYENSANLGRIYSSIWEFEVRLFNKMDEKFKDLSQDYSDEDAEY